MQAEKKIVVDAIRDGEQAHAARCRYEPPRVVKTRRLSEVVGQNAAVPSGAPAPAPRPPDPG